MLTAANRADQAYSIATTVTLAATDMEEPSYNLDFAAGRAALALGDLVKIDHVTLAILPCHVPGHFAAMLYTEPVWF
jgi:hypothetical protein